MAIGDDFKDVTAPPVKRAFHYPPPDGTGEIDWPAGVSFGNALSAAFPPAVRTKILSFNAKIRISIDVTEV